MSKGKFRDLRDKAIANGMKLLSEHELRMLNEDYAAGWIASRKAALEEAASMARGYAPGAAYAILALVDNPPAKG